MVVDQIRTFLERGFDVGLYVWKESEVTLTQKLKFLGEIEAKSRAENRFRVVSLDPNQEYRESTKKRVVGLKRLRRVAGAVRTRWSSTELFHYPIELISRLPQTQVDLEVFHYSFAAVWLLEQARRPAKKVVVHFHNLESDLSKLRENNAATRAERWLYSRNTRRLRANEREILGEVSEAWWLSGRDFQLLEGHPLDIEVSRVNRTGSRWVPPTIPREWWSAQRRWHRSDQPVAQSLGKTGMQVGLIGALDFRPNVLGLEWVLDRVCPLLEKEGFNGSIFVVGRGATDDLIRRMRKYSFVKWLGFVENLDDFWKSLDMSLVPDVAGSGVRMKLLESLARGVEALATSSAALRLHPGVEPCAGLHISDQPQGWVDWILQRRVETRVSESQDPLRWLDRQFVYQFLEQEKFWGDVK